ncbi:MAG: hypothetical protein ACYC1K_02520 [Minisyncoccota bacterium]
MTINWAAVGHFLFALVPPMLFVFWVIIRIMRGAKASRQGLEAEMEQREQAEANRIKKIRDHQLNVWNQVFNIISGWKEVFPLLLVTKAAGTEAFSIFVGRKLEHGTEVLLQLDFDFVDGFGRDCEGHIFYAPYGADMYFSVPSHIDVREQMWLSDLIWNRIQREFSVDVSR